MSPGGLLSTGTGTSLLTAGAEDDGVEEPGVECVADALGVGVLAGVVVELVPPQAATPVTRAATPSARRGRRIDKGAREIFMNQQCNLDDETTMRMQGSRFRTPRLCAGELDRGGGFTRPETPKGSGDS